MEGNVNALAATADHVGLDGITHILIHMDVHVKRLLQEVHVPSASLVIREVQIKTRMTYHLTPIRMAIISKSTNRVSKDAEKREPSCAVGGNIDWCSHCEKQCGGS